MALSYDDVVAVLGPIDRPLATRIAATDATPAELAEAWAWVSSEDALIDEGRPLPSGTVAELIEILQPDEGDGER